MAAPMPREAPVTMAVRGVLWGVWWGVVMPWLQRKVGVEGLFRFRLDE